MGAKEERKNGVTCSLCGLGVRILLKTHTRLNRKCWTFSHIARKL